MKARFAAVFASRSREAWTTAFTGVEACVTPVLDLAEVPEPRRKASLPLSVIASAADIAAEWASPSVSPARRERQ